MVIKVDKAKILNVLMHCVGDHIQCPGCSYSFVPDTQTQRDAFDLYTELKSEFSKDSAQHSKYMVSEEDSANNLKKKYTKLYAELELCKKLLKTQKKETGLYRDQVAIYESKNALVRRWFDEWNEWNGTQK